MALSIAMSRPLPAQAAPLARASGRRVGFSCSGFPASYRSSGRRSGGNGAGQGGREGAGGVCECWQPGQDAPLLEVIGGTVGCSACMARGRGLIRGGMWWGRGWDGLSERERTGGCSHRSARAGRSGPRGVLVSGGQAGRWAGAARHGARRPFARGRQQQAGEAAAGALRLCTPPAAPVVQRRRSTGAGADGVRGGHCTRGAVKGGGVTGWLAGGGRVGKGLISAAGIAVTVHMGNRVGPKKKAAGRARRAAYGDSKRAPKHLGCSASRGALGFCCRLSGQLGGAGSIHHSSPGRGSQAGARHGVAAVAALAVRRSEGGGTGAVGEC
jgi:hypothetical protein